MLCFNRRGASTVRKVKVDGEVIYVCEVCGLGYRDKETALSCEVFCSTYGACSLEITRKAVYFPRSWNKTGFE